MTIENRDNFTVGRIHVSPQHNTMVNGEHECRLQPKAMALLHYLATNNDRVISNDELLDNVWQGRVVTHSSIQKCVNALRSAFTELDSGTEYIVYFSKQGYQLVTPEINRSSNEVTATNSFLLRPFIAVTAFIIIAASFIYLLYPFNTDDKTVSEHVDISQFTQVQPYVSNTGRERIIEPHPDSDRVAVIRDELNSENLENQSHLFIQGRNGLEWQVSVARGHFVALAWSLSGRNLVAIDAHNEDGAISDTDSQQNSADYYTFHIYTLDFKGEKVIEKNLLSHWQGNVSSVSWWSEGILEFTAYQGDQNERARYRYNIAEQNLSRLTSLKDRGGLIASHVFNKQTAILSSLKAKEQIQFLDEHQTSIGQWPIPFNVISMNWVSDGQGVLLLSDGNQLSILYTDGRLDTVHYSPTVNGQIKHARSKNKGKNIVLTVDALLKSSQSSTSDLESNVNGDLAVSPERFMQKGGGFIYSTAPNIN